MTFTLLFLFFYLGACWGSFLFLVYERTRLSLSIAFPSSHCDFCKNKLPYWSLFPIFSYQICHHHCCFCGSVISAQSLHIEFLSGIIFLCYHQLFLENLFFAVSLMLVSYLATEDLAIKRSNTSLLAIPAFSYTILNFDLTNFFALLCLLFFISNDFENTFFFSKFGQGDLEVILFFNLLFTFSLTVRAVFISSGLALFSMIIFKNRSVPFIPYLLTSFLIFMPK